MPAGSTAATAFSEIQQRNIRSTNIMTVNEAVETIRGPPGARLLAPRPARSTRPPPCWIARFGSSISSATTYHNCRTGSRLEAPTAVGWHARKGAGGALGSLGGSPRPFRACHPSASLSGPKAQSFTQPKAAPWGASRGNVFPIGPTGQPFAGRTVGPLGRCARTKALRPQDVALGCKNWCPFRAVAAHLAETVLGATSLHEPGPNGFIHHSDFYTNQGADDGCRRVWMLALGPGVRPGQTIDRPVPITAAATTGLRYLGL